MNIATLLRKKDLHNTHTNSYQGLGQLSENQDKANAALALFDSN